MNGAPDKPRSPNAARPLRLVLRDGALIGLTAAALGTALWFFLAFVAMAGGGA
jgi:hypothetical protein